MGDILHIIINMNNALFAEISLLKDIVNEDFLNF